MFLRDTVPELKTVIKEIEEDIKSGNSEISRRAPKPNKLPGITEEEYDNLLGDTMSMFT